MIQYDDAATHNITHTMLHDDLKASFSSSPSFAIALRKGAACENVSYCVGVERDTNPFEASFQYASENVEVVVARRDVGAPLERIRR